MLKNNSFYSIFFLIILLMSLSGCKINNDDKHQITAENSILIYDIYNQKIVLYNTNTFSLEMSNKNEGSKLQYSFKTKNNYFTSGDSTKNEFEIIKLNEKSVETVYALENQNTEAIFPLAQNDDHLFFIKSNYGDEGLSGSIIAEYRDGRLYEFTSTIGLISYGALLEELLYYTVYDKNTDSYDLYSIKYSDYNSIPSLLKNNLQTGELFILNNSLYLSDNDLIYSYATNDSFNKSSENFYDTKNNVLIQIEADSEQKNGLVLTVIDASTKKQICSIDNIIDFTINGSVLTAYCNGNIENIELNKNN